MPPDETRRDPPPNHAPLLWVILYLGCLVFGIVLAALVMPFQESIAALVRVVFGIMLVLTVVLISLSAQRLIKVITVPRAAWRWVVLLAAVMAGVAVGVWSAAAQSPDGSVVEGLGTAFLSALGFAAATALGTHAIVMILASRADVSRRHC